MYATKAILNTAVYRLCDGFFRAVLVAPYSGPRGACAAAIFRADLASRRLSHRKGSSGSRSSAALWYRCMRAGCT